MSKTPEGQILKAIMDWLAAKHILAFRQNSGSLRNPAGKPIRFGVPGMADILVFQRCEFRLGANGESIVLAQTIRPLWIECKAAKGKQSELQKSFQAQVESEGHKYVVARSIEDVEEALR
jgi:hypothetical protein